MVYVSKYNNYFLLVDTIVCTKFISLYPKTMESSLQEYSALYRLRLNG